MKPRNREWQSATVKRAFEVLSDVPPVVADALRELALAQAQIEEENRAADAKPKKTKKSNGDGKVAIGAGIGVGGVKEVIDYIFQAGFGHDDKVMGFLELSLIDGGIVGVLTTLVTWLSRRAR